MFGFDLPLVLVVLFFASAVGILVGKLGFFGAAFLAAADARIAAAIVGITSGVLLVGGILTGFGFVGTVIYTVATLVVKLVEST